MSVTPDELFDFVLGRLGENAEKVAGDLENPESDASKFIAGLQRLARDVYAIDWATLFTEEAEPPAIELRAERSHGSDEKLRGLIQEELRRLAQTYLRRGGPIDDQAIRTIVDAMYHHLCGAEPFSRADRLHIFIMAGEEVRRLLSEDPVQRSALPSDRPQDSVPTPGPSSSAYPTPLARPKPPPDVLARDEGVDRLAKKSKTLSQLFTLYAFSGRTPQEISELMDMSKSEIEKNLGLAIVELHLEKS
jgi:hypothetical protein